MQTMTDKTSFEDLVEQYLGRRLPQGMAAAISLPELPPDGQNFIKRMLTLMKLAGYPATEFTPILIRWLSTIPSVLPSAWGGRVPPITVPNRHQKLDAYVAGYKWPSGNGQARNFVDIGCGFPPVTTADTSRNLPGWRVFGVDRSFAAYVLRDCDGHYACFDADGTFLYFQPAMNPSGRKLYENPESTKTRFKNLFAELLPLLQNLNDAKSETVEKDGNRLTHNHIRDFETNNLSFVESEMEKLKLPPAQVVRCMNMLLYFTPDTRKKMLSQAAKSLGDDGILIAGTNGLGIEARYAVYQKENGRLAPAEFAFGFDNLRPIGFMPWFTLHENDPEAMLLARLTGAIRADRTFWPEFIHRVDEVQEQNGLCRRGSDGFLQFSEEEMSVIELREKLTALWRQMVADGYLDGAVGALERAGYKAWQNSVGDIAVRPPADSLPLGASN